MVTRMNNMTQTWAQGRFIDLPQYADWSQEEKRRAHENEQCFVRPRPLDNKICRCDNPEDAKWIAQRLNLASKLEQLTYDYTVGKTEGEEIRDFVTEYIDQR